MAGRRIAYLVALAGCLVFYSAYKEWLSWLLLMSLAWLPVLSLLCSLPAMLTLRLQYACPTALSIGEAGAVSLIVHCPFPHPPVRGKLQLEQPLTGLRSQLRPGDALPTNHCGQLIITPHKAFVYDYLGLLRFPIRRKAGCTALVRPRPITVENPPDASHQSANAWRPKPGGGYAENHELRLYRPGDSLRQLHWKLSAKTGKLILREPMERLPGLAILTTELHGDPAQLDKKLGQLLWMSRHLLDLDLPHRICCLTGSGLEQFRIQREDDILAAIDILLAAKPADPNIQPQYADAAWHYRVGGDES